MDSYFMGTTEQPLGRVTGSERLLAILAHLLTLFFFFFAPLVIYLLKKDESAFVRYHAREALNFQITLAIAYVISFLLMIVVVGIIMLMVLGLVHLILAIIATVRAADNQLYRYPFTIRFIQ